MRTFMHQPKALNILIPTEMASIYGYFSLQAILIFYLIKQLAYSDAAAYSFSGQFIALAFLMPVLGGWVADRYLGNRIAVILGGVLLCIGYFLLSFGQPTFLPGLSFIIIGNGLFRPSISSLIGEFYNHNDSRREAGFTLVYTGANIGSFLAVISVGYIQKFFGWSACFVASSFVLLVAICLFRWGYRYFNSKGLSPTNSKIREINFSKKILIFFYILLALLVIYYLLKYAILNNYFVCLFALIFFLYLAKIYFQLEFNARKHLIALLILFAIATYYKAMFFESYLVINVFTERLVDRTLFGHEIPATVFLSLGSLFTIIIGPLFAYFWQKNNKFISNYFKCILSILIIGIGMQTLAFWLSIESDTVLPSVSIFMFRFLFAISELFILPIGLSMITEYAAKNRVGLMIGGWYITAALGGKLSGILANDANIPRTSVSLHDLKIIYH